MPRYLAMLFAAALFLPTAAIAHSNAVETNPADGAKLDKLPAEITVTFDERPKTAAVALSSPDGEVHVLKARIAGNAIVAKLPSRGPRGTYGLSYRVVSADGHPVSGTTAFAVTTGPTPVAKPAPTPTPARADQAFPIPMIALLGVALAALAGVTLAARAKRR
jgi:methionine-rich copper-binding protein CopC